MSLPHYDVWILNDNYTRRAYINKFLDLEYRISLDTYGYANLEFECSHSKITDMLLMKRLHIYRNSVLLFGGIILRETFTIPDTAPRTERYKIGALESGCYSDWRVVYPLTSQEYDTHTDSADDVAKYYVRKTMGSLAEAARQISDVSVAADTGTAPSMTYEARNVILHTVLQNIATQAGLDWRFCPTETGVEFRTWYPHAGLDRTRGNGVNDEVVFSIDRRNFNSVSSQKDILTHYNHVTIWGQGEGVKREMVEGKDDTYIALYKRRERAVDARQISTTATLEAQIPGALQERKPIELMTVKPKSIGFQNQWNLGDQVTIEIDRYNRLFTMDGKITDIVVNVADDGTEEITPTLEKL